MRRAAGQGAPAGPQGELVPAGAPLSGLSRSGPAAADPSRGAPPSAPPQADAAAAPPWDREVDARGLLCPLPVLRARKLLLAMAPGQVLRVLATDPAAVIDMPHFAREAGHTLTAVLPEGAATAYYLRRGA